MVKVEIDGEIITATPEHPFYANGDWKAAGLLETGDAILLFSGKLATVKEVKYQGSHAPLEITDTFFEEPEIIEENSTKVFNFEVEGWHTYFVGWLRVLVHNAGICLREVVEEGVKKIDEVIEVVKNKVLELSRAKYPNHTKMLDNAVGKGHSLENLKRGKGTKAAKKNRYESQKDIRKKQGGPKKDHDYDEFPYASTTQGGKGAHVEEVLSAENQAAGRELGEFYRKEGIKPDDIFDIKIID